MARYFFEITNGGVHPDDVGTECRDLKEVHAIALRTLTSIAGEEAAQHDRHSVTVMVRDEAGHPVLDTTLTLTTAWLNRTRN